MATAAPPELIPLSEFAAHIGSPDVAIQLLDRAGAKLQRRWDGTFAVDSTLAAKVLAEHRAEQEEWSRLHGEYQGWLKQREHDRAVVWQQAYREAHAAEFAKQVEYAQRLSDQGTDPSGEYGKGWASGGGFPISRNADPAVDSRARDVAKEARREWDRKHPELDFEAWRRRAPR